MISLSAIKWQIISGVAGVSLLAATGGLIYSRIEIRHLRNVVAKLTTKIKTVEADLATETTNRANLETAIARQNAEWQRQSTAAATRLATTQQKLEAAQVAARKARARATAMLTIPLNGDTVCERVMDADRRVLESLQ